MIRFDLTQSLRGLQSKVDTGENKLQGLEGVAQAVLGKFMVLGVELTAQFVND